MQPGAKGGPLIKSLQREICLDKNLLGDIFHVLAFSQNPACHGKHPVLMAPDKLLKRLFVLTLGPPDQFAVFRPAGRLGGTPLGGSRGEGRVKGFHFWDAWHRFLVTLILSRLPEAVSDALLRHRQDCSCVPSYLHLIITSR